MNTARRRHKRRLCIQHRRERYCHAIQKVIDGKAEPEYATKRWHKLQEVIRNGR